MKLRCTIPSCLTIAMLLATASFGQQVKTDYDRGANFTRYKTYSWGGVRTADPLLVDRIKSAVNSSLAAKGLNPVESGGDLRMMAMEMTEDHRTLNTYYDNFGGGFGGGWGWRGGWGDGFGEATTTEQTYTVGTLVVDVFDANTKKLIWRGSASDALSKSSGKNIRNLDKGVVKMFEHFPPDARKRSVPE